MTDVQIEFKTLKKILKKDYNAFMDFSPEQDRLYDGVIEGRFIKNKLYSRDFRCGWCQGQQCYYVPDVSGERFLCCSNPDCSARNKEMGAKTSEERGLFSKGMGFSYNPKR